MPTATDTTIETERFPHVHATLDRIEEALPALPAAVLRFQRTVAERMQSALCDSVASARSSVDAVTSTTTTAAKTVTGTARWASERTLDTARVAARTVRGQAQAQAGIAADAISDEVSEIGDDITDAAARASDIVGAAIDSAAAEISPNDYSEWTKAALYERAQDLEIEGRSTMSKRDLIAALRAA